MAKTIAFVNQKGGVGKTTSCVNLGSCLQAAGAKVLVCDFDPQGNATSGFGVDKGAVFPTIYDVLIAGAPVENAIVHTKYSDVLPANKALAGASVEMIALDRREYLLKDALAKVAGRYDFILIDCPPSLELLTLNCLCAADTVLVPVQCEYYALEGLSDLLSTIRIVKSRLNPPHRPGGAAADHVRWADQPLPPGGRGSQTPFPRKGFCHRHSPQRPALRGPQPRQTGERLRRFLPGVGGLQAIDRGTAGQEPSVTQKGRITWP